MAHQLQLEKTKYRQWAKAGLGLGYLKEGLAPFCQDIATQQHKDILDNIQRTKYLQVPVMCGVCQLRNLRPDHVKAGKNVCPIGQINCNCCFPNGKNACLNNICGSIYDGIINSHASNPPAPNWKNTDSQMWTSNPWSIAKCFINAPGYLNKTSAADTDITGLCHLIVNNTYFQSHISCSLTGANIFSKVRDHRNTIFHSSSQELEEATANSYIDDMITVLQDPKELVTNPYAQQAVLNLQELKNKDFLITSENLEELLKQVREDLMHELNELKSTVSTKDEVEELERKLSNIKDLLKENKDEMEKSAEITQQLVKQTKDEMAKSAETTQQLVKQTKDEMAKSAEITLQLVKQTKDEMAKSAETTQQFVKQTKDEMAKSAETTQQLVKQTKDEVSKSAETTQQLVKQTKDEMAKSAETTQQLVKQTKDEVSKSAESTQQLVKQTKDEMAVSTNEMKMKMDTLMSEQEEIKKKQRVEESPDEKQLKYEKTKSELQRQMIERYRKTLLQVPVIPTNQKTYIRSFDEIYIRPTITREVKGEKGETEEKVVNSMSEIFTKNGVPLKSIYVLGDAGTGKSSFCKYLVNCWCKAHSEEYQDENSQHETDKLETDSDNDKNVENNHQIKIDNRDNENKNHKFGKSGNESETGNEPCDTHETEKLEKVTNNENDECCNLESQTDDSDNENDNHKSDKYEDESHRENEPHTGEDKQDDFHYVEIEKYGEEYDSTESDSEEKDSIDSGSDSEEYDSINTWSDIEDFDIMEFLKYDIDIIDIEELECEIKECGNKFNGVKEMRKFDILFYIALRRYQNVVSIHEMLKKHYDSNIFDELLDKESEKIIILLDGLDEWSSATITDNQFQTEGLPEQQFLKDYTIVTTSRPWKIHTLEISETEIQQVLKLKGFDDKSEMIMIYRTIKHINSDRGDNQDIKMCKRKLNEESLRSLKQVPIMLQQLICLWIDGKLDKSSKCAIYTGMLELFFTWNEKKGTRKCASKPMKIDLPQYFAMKQKCKSNGHLIHDMSQLAYETLFKCTKDQSLTFDINVFDQLEISDELRESCLKIGLLTEDRCPSLFVSEPPSSMFSFIHKSVQEFLAAVNIAINYKTKTDSSNNPGNAETQRDYNQFVQEVFQKCSTVNEILEQSNVIIMLCGLEPRLATHVSRYICDIVNKDPLVQRYRRTVDSYISDHLGDYRCIKDIQNLIFDSMKECIASTVESRPTFYIGDIYIGRKNYSYISRYDDYCDIVCSSIDQQQITPDSVRSIYIDHIQTENVKFSKYLPKFKHLEKIIIKYDMVWDLSSTESVDTMIDEVNKSVAETIKINTSTLKSLSLSGTSILYNDELYSLCKIVVHLLPSMNNLVAIKMTRIQMSHDDNSRFCEFLKGTSHLEQIHIDIECECWKQHDVDLSKHQQLQYLEFGGCLCLTFTDTVNLEVFKCLNIKSTNYIKIFDSIMKCEGLKELNLNLDSNDKSVSFHTSITDRLVSVLPFLHNLSKLDLRWFRLTDNIIKVPSEMKSLKNIDLWCVIMSLTTWKKFVDSLPSIPHTVNVGLGDRAITVDGEEFNDDWLSYGLIGLGGEKGNEAIQYVVDQKQLFLVISDDSLFFRFSIKK